MISASTTTDGNGSYSFIVPIGGSYTVTPSLAAYTFIPASQTFSGVSANQRATQVLAQPAACTTAAPTVYGPGNSTSATFWYLGGAPAVSGYLTSTTLQMQAPASGCVNPTITWSTDSPSRLSIAPSADGTSATLTSLGASAYQKGFDIHVTVTYNGNTSAPFSVFINTPYTMTTSLPGEYYSQYGCGCSALLAPPGAVGYAMPLDTESQT
jgi:hypothetical protein